ncbi:hypothetical protein ZYGR_0I03270 [Zygosaccharomyces rouxii]|uniref:DNA ligase n=2 Tax=Zygosaccharomyces rouxii TaxID=4956 RepID=C5DTE3_ZYGRC|nr:uncharacterized protein ZYRO0C07854g [Zygosaccharomyces rouxii]KAH9201765.1 ATP dependent DNA ligase domain-containing protein [Zygosaccharomyces rouxii]GAV48030.1 hypothetical protein ZYGR_0I03270 [Zygosaccharomyces rouxii]CAR27054.1 ZYRO0C07854p [Zygosaccharomyces rouxii]
MSTKTDDQNKPHNFAPSPDFKWLCDELFVKIDNVQKQTRDHGAFKSLTVKYFEIISFFVKLWRKTVGDNIYPALILILPYRDRRIFNIKDYTLIKAICSFLRLPANSVTEKRLLRWKRRAGRGIKLSDFCVEEIRRRRSEPLNGERITIDKLNECLDQLAEERNTKGRGFKSLADSSVFKYCLENMSFTEMKYYFDIILKSRVIGGQEHKFLNCWHPDARDYLSVVSDLKTVADKLWDPSHRLKNDDLGVNLGLPFAPFLAKRLYISYDKVALRLKSDFYIEEKMDGERIQLHYMDYGRKLKWFSRRGNDYTYLYGEDIGTGTVAKYLQLDPKVRECVLDGEMISFDTEENSVLPFGLVKSSARDSLTAEGILTQGYRPLYMVIDFLYLNGVSLINVPLNTRKQYLSAILNPCPHAVEIIQSMHCYDDTSIKSSLEKAIMMGSEGIILKHFKSKYEIGARTDNWIKIKPEYLEQFGENLDLLVIGRDPGKKDSLMCGLAVLEGDEEPGAQSDKQVVNLDSEEEEEPRKAVKKFISFCTIANGISQEEFKQIERKTAGKWKNTEDHKPPKILEFGSKLPEEWIYPEDSVVLEVKARSLDNTESSGRKFKVGCTLHGGYCRRIREDKNWTECYTLYELWQERRKKVPLSEDSNNQKPMKSKKIRRPRIVSRLNQTLSCDDEAKTSSIFDGLIFYVISDYMASQDSERISKEQLCDLISGNGGKLTFNVISDHRVKGGLRIISGKYTLECKALIERGYDILSPQWLMDCVNTGFLVTIEPRHCFSVSEDMEKIARTRVDHFGDSYDVEITEDRLRDILTSKEFDSDFSTGSLDVISDVEDIPLFLFSRRIVFIPEGFSYLDTQLLKHKVRLYGGQLTDNVNQCNLIIVPDGKINLRGRIISDLRRLLSTFAAMTELPPAIPWIVIPAWIDRSIEENIQVPEEDFLAV